MQTFKTFIFEDLAGSGNELYFAYGHNTNEKLLEKLSPHAHILGRASVDGYKYVMRQYSDIIKDDNSTVQGILWSIPKDREGPINKYEEYYHRLHINVNYKGKQYKAFAFQIDKKHYDGKTPSKEYIETIKDGYKENNIPLSQLDTALKDINLSFH